jgi:uncharacterized protein (TIGR02271 family)
MNAMNDWVLREGMDVLASDGEKVGEVQDAMGESFTVKEGWFFPKEHVIPASVITAVDDSAVHLGVTKEQALDQDWGATTATGTWGSTAPVDGEPVAATGAYDETTTTGAAAGVTEVAPDLAPLDTTAYERDEAATPMTDQDTIRVPLSEEELVATKRQVERGAVRVERDVVAEEQSLDVPVTEEEVRVSRHVVDRDLTPGDDAFQEGTIEIPVRGEEVDVEKRARVTGELEIDKQATTRTERVSDTVRREEAHVVDENGNVIAGDDTTIVDDDQRRPL